LTARTDLLLVLGLRPQASARAIERAYVERRAQAAKRLEQGEPGARAELEQLDRVIRRLEEADVAGLEGPSPARSKARRPRLVHELVSTPARQLALPWEGTAALACGILACLLSLVLYLATLSGAEVGIGFPLDNPIFYLVFALALAAEMLAHTELQASAHAHFMVRHGHRPRAEPEAVRVGRARLGRRLGRAAAILNVVFLVLVVISFFHSILG
jgi:hypothetical protein